MTSKTICGAKTRSGTLCRRAPMPNGRCYLHGGATPSGVASPHFKHGRHCRALPTRMAARFEEALSDPELLALRADIALTDARLEDLLGRVDTGESGATWRAAQQALDAFNKAKRQGKAVEMAEHFRTLEGLIAEGAADYAAWEEVHRMLRQRKSLVESERKHLIDTQQMISVAQLMVLVGAVVNVFTESVQKYTDGPTGQRVLTDTSTAIRGLLSHSPG